MTRLLLVAFLLAPSLTFAADTSRVVTLDWEPLKKAASYDIEIRGANGQTTKHEVLEAKWKGSLAPGQYSFRVRAKDRRNVAGPWGNEEVLTVKIAAVKVVQPRPNEEKLVDDDKVVVTDFSWTPAKGADRYLFTVRSDDFEKQIETKETQARAELPVGAVYKWSVQTVSAAGQKSEEQFVKYTLLSRASGKPVFEAPSGPFVRHLNWSKSGLADGTDISISRQDPDSKEWSVQQESKVIAEDKMDFPREWPGGHYKVTGFAVKGGKPVSLKSEIEFDVFSGDRSPASETQHALEAYFSKDSGRFFHFNYIFSSVDYTAVSTPMNSRSSFSAITGTVNAGGGYMWGENRGLRGSVSFGGIIINDKNNFQKGFEADYIQRIRLSALTDSRWWAGLAMNDVADVAKSVTATETTVSMMPVMSAAAGGDVWYALSGLWGVKGQLMLGLPLSAKNAQGENLQSGMKLQAGGYVTYNFTAQRQLHMGAMMLQENYKFNSVASEISLKGTYLNLQYEMGF